MTSQMAPARNDLPRDEQSFISRVLKKRTLLLITGPLFILPIGVITSLLFSSYEGNEIGHLQRIPLFLQGSTDWGGSNIFAATMAAYVVFGLLGSVYLTLKLSESPPTNILRNLARSVWYLKYHIGLFALFGPMHIDYDAFIRPNDFRNMFLMALLCYVISVLWIAFLHWRLSSLRLRLALAPLFGISWLILGSDGTTAKAGQILHAGENPAETPRGVRHSIMLSWHRLCDDLLGDVR